MLPIGAVFAFVGRQIGRLLQLAFNWATLVLFGQVAKDKQLFLSVMAALSLVWPVALAGVAIPSVGTFLLGFVTVPDWADGNFPETAADGQWYTVWGSYEASQ